MWTETSDIEYLISQLESSDEIERENSAYLIGELASEAIELAKNTLKNKKDIEKRNALAKPDIFNMTIEALIPLTKDKVAWVRGNAVEALGKMRAQTAVNTLLDCLDDDELVVVASAVESLGLIGDHSATGKLTELLETKEWSIRMQAARALGNLRNPAVLNALSLALSDERTDVSIAAREALDQLSEDPSYLDSPLRA